MTLIGSNEDNIIRIHEGGRVPNNGRSLEGIGNQTYSKQLQFTPSSIVQPALNHIKVLDIGCLESSASIEMEKIINERGKSSTVSGIDIQERTSIQRINFMGGDIEESQFKERLIKELGRESQHIIFMNTVFFYLKDPLSIVKFIVEELLSSDGVFLFNMIPQNFITGSGFQFWQFIEELEKRRKSTDGLKVVSENNKNFDNLKVYHIFKSKKGVELYIPILERSILGRNGYYSYQYRFKNENESNKKAVELIRVLS